MRVLVDRVAETRSTLQVDGERPRLLYALRIAAPYHCVYAKTP